MDDGGSMEMDRGLMTAPGALGAEPGGVGALVDGGGRKPGGYVATSRLGSGDIGITDLKGVIELAKLMANSGFMVPDHLQGNEGACAGVIMQSLRWRMDPFAVAQQTYITSSKEKIDGRETGRTIQRLAYMSSVIAAVVNTRAPITSNIDYRYEGVGPSRKCVAFVVTKSGEMKEAETPELGRIPDFNKRSPLWKSNPDQQLAYLAGKLLVRRHFPEILMGVAIEGDDVGETIDVTPRSPQATDRTAMPAPQPQYALSQTAPVDYTAAEEAVTTPVPAVENAPEEPAMQPAATGSAPTVRGEPSKESVSAQPEDDAGRASGSNAARVEKPAATGWEVQVRIRRLCAQARMTRDFASCRRAAEESFEGNALKVALGALQLEETRAQINPDRFKTLVAKLERAATKEDFATLKARTNALQQDGSITETERDIYLQEIVFAEIDQRLKAQGNGQAQRAA